MWLGTDSVRWFWPALTSVVKRKPHRSSFAKKNKTKQKTQKQTNKKKLWDIFKQKLSCKNCQNCHIFLSLWKHLPPIFTFFQKHIFSLTNDKCQYIWIQAQKHGLYTYIQYTHQLICNIHTRIQITCIYTYINVQIMYT